MPINYDSWFFEPLEEHKEEIEEDIDDYREYIRDLEDMQNDE